MAAAGYVERRVDTDDARIRHAHLTESGSTLLRAAAATHLAGIERHFASLLGGTRPADLLTLFEAMRSSTSD